MEYKFYWMWSINVKIDVSEIGEKMKKKCKNLSNKYNYLKWKGNLNKD